MSQRARQASQGAQKLRPTVIGNSGTQPPLPLNFNPSASAKTGAVHPDTAALIEAILVRRVHPQQGFRSALGIMRLGKHYGGERLEAACRRALRLQAYSYKSLDSILKRGLDRQSLPDADADTPLPEHANVRGPGYFH